MSDYEREDKEEGACNDPDRKTWFDKWIDSVPEEESE
jgi:hypothetical protein